MLTETPLPAWAAGGRVLAVGGQTARPVDDVGILTYTGGWVLAQAKKRLALSSDVDGDLAAALEQLVDAVHAGVPDRPPNQGSLRPLAPGTDRVLILTDERAPKTVRVGLADVVDRLRTEVAGSASGVSTPYLHLGVTEFSLHWHDHTGYGDLIHVARDADGRLLIGAYLLPWRRVDRDPTG